ncbi:ATP-binding protein [Elusimicrobiota bacterium]
MRFITGPRQSGKTTVSKLKLEKSKPPGVYYLWDLRSVRKRYKENELFFTQDAAGSKGKTWVCFDELHKMPKWKNILKGIFDQTEEGYRFIVTGSAKLDLFRKAGDSLSGRYFTFHLFPLCLGELRDAKRLGKVVPRTAAGFIEIALDRPAAAKGILPDLLAYGGFPEPLLRQSESFLRKWAEGYLDRVINEDIGALTRIIDREYIFDLYNLLPEMVGSPISQRSLSSHLELSAPTVKNHLRRLGDFFLAFRVSPYGKNIKRAILKAPKIYVYDWTRIRGEAARFENFVACELNALAHLWADASGEKFSLCYVRDKEKRETDFLVLKNDKPWCLFEAKLSDGPVARHHLNNAQALGGIPVVQVCREDGVAMRQEKDVFRLSASRLF